MHYFSQRTVANSFMELKDKTPNKFWGLLGILKCMDSDMLKSEVTYTISGEKLSLFLEDVFYLGDDKRDYGNSVWFIKFSKYWLQCIKDNFLAHTPNIYPIIAYLYKNKSFERQLNYDELLLLFGNDYHFSIDQINEIFDTTQNFEIEYSASQYSPAELLATIKDNLNNQELRPSISMESPYSVVARPGELSRAPFIQTLYAGQQSLECLMMAKFDIEDYYPSGKTQGLNKYNRFNNGANHELFDLNKFYNDILTSNLKFDNKNCLRFASSLLTKPFVILTGLSGSGKTKLAQAFAMWISKNETQYKIVPVGADWTNREPLLGYPNALQEKAYVRPDSGVLDLILNAKEHSEKPYFLILDEMNLSHVERYFADFLSTMESGEEVLLHAGDEDWDGVPAKICLPKNLFIVGTVNIDETTYMFSPKVLDRANVIEFRVTEAEMGDYLKNSKPLKMDDLKGQGAAMGSGFLELALDKELASEKGVQLADVLLKFFTELKKAGAEFGYRSASEIKRFAAVVEKTAPEWMLDEITDAAIMQKLLPKLHGSRRKLEPILKTLAGLCLKEGEKPEEYLALNGDADPAKALYPVSLEKIQRMYRGLIDNGFTSYAEA